MAGETPARAAARVVRGSRASRAPAEGPAPRHDTPETRRPGRKIRILVVDDHPVVRQGLARLIELEPDMEICGEAEDTTQAIERLSSVKADLAIVDLSLKRGSGLELVKAIKARFPRTPTLVLSVHDESVFAERVLRAGGSGYLMKEEAPGNVVTAIRHVLDGNIYVSARFAERVVRGFVGGRPLEATSPVALLSDRELEVFQLIGRGMETRRVAETLYLSIKTVETYRHRIKKKLAIKGAAELVHRAIEWVRSEAPG